MNYIVFDIETSGLNPFFDNVVTCICAKDSEGNTFTQSAQNAKVKELELIKSFIDWLKSRDYSNYTVITKNGKQFDIRFLFERAFMCGGAEAYKLMQDIYSFFYFMKNIDLQEITEKYISLITYTNLKRGE